MAITTLAQYSNAALQRLRLYKASTTGTLNTPFSLWAITGSPGAGTLAVGNTTTGVLFDDSYTGAPAIDNFAAGATGYIRSASFRENAAGSVWLYDRLWGAGAISLSGTGTTTFSSQPSYSGRLPSGPDYTALDVFLEFSNSVTATTLSVVVTYTNEAGVTGRSCDAFTNTGALGNRLYPLNLQAGDKGVQKIESVIVSGTGITAGDCNIIVARRLVSVDSRVQNLSDNQTWDQIGMPQVFDTSCLWLVNICDSNNLGAATVFLDIING